MGFTLAFLYKSWPDFLGLPGTFFMQAMNYAIYLISGQYSSAQNSLIEATSAYYRSIIRAVLNLDPRPITATSSPAAEEDADSTPFLDIVPDEVGHGHCFFGCSAGDECLLPATISSFLGS